MSSRDLARLADQGVRTIAINPIKLKEGWVLKKLSQKHKHIVALHLQSVSRMDIGAICGCTPEYVSMLLRQPLVQAYLKETEAYMDERLRALQGKSIDAIESGLDSGDGELQLKAARLQLEATGKLKQVADKERSAEDVVADILARATVVIGQNVQVNQISKGE